MRWLVLLSILLVGTGCATAERTLEDGGPAPANIPAPTTDLAADDAPWVEFEARWLCDLERSTYGDPSEVAAALDERLDDEDIDRAGYDTFLSRLDTERELSLHVQAAVLERCGD